MTCKFLWYYYNTIIIIITTETIMRMEIFILVFLLHDYNKSTKVKDHKSKIIVVLIGACPNLCDPGQLRLTRSPHLDCFKCTAISSFCDAHVGILFCKDYENISNTKLIVDLIYVCYYRSHFPR